MTASATPRVPSCGPKGYADVVPHRMQRGNTNICQWSRGSAPSTPQRAEERRDHSSSFFPGGPHFPHWTVIRPKPALSMDSKRACRCPNSEQPAARRLACPVLRGSRRACPPASRLIGLGSRPAAGCGLRCHGLSAWQFGLLLARSEMPCRRQLRGVEPGGRHDARRTAREGIFHTPHTEKPPVVVAWNPREFGWGGGCGTPTGLPSLASPPLEELGFLGK